MRIALISCAIATSLTLGSVARADGDEPPSTWMLQPSPYDTSTGGTDNATHDANDETTSVAKNEEIGGATVSFAVRTKAGSDIRHARVSMDGQILTGALDGWAVTIPPGEHVFEFAAAGYVPQEHTVKIHGGATAELLTVELAAVELADDPASTPLQPTPYALSDETRPPEARSDPWMVTYITGGAAIVALGIGTALGVSSNNQVANLKETCAPNCTSDQIQAVRSELTAADVAFGVGLVSGAVAVVWAITHPREPAHENKAAIRFNVHGLSGQF